MSFTLVSTPEAAQNAYSFLLDSKHIFFDCEGDNLGCVGGQLRLISVGTVRARQVFLFDVAALRRESIQPLLDVLGNSAILKIVWDGRLDCVEMRRSYGVELRGVLDLQVADIASRAITGVSAQTKKYQRWNPLHTVRFLDTEGIHCLASLKSVLAAHGVKSSGPKSPNGKISHDRWLERPLPEEYLTYAAGDIYELERVFTFFRSRSYVGTRNQPRPVLEEQSARYVAMHSGPVQQGNIYHSSNLFPLEILTPAALSYGRMSRCGKCYRLLSEASFTYRDGNVRGRFVAPTVHGNCKVCYILDARAAAKRREAARGATSMPAPHAPIKASNAGTLSRPPSIPRAKTQVMVAPVSVSEPPPVPQVHAGSGRAASSALPLLRLLAVLRHEIALQRAASTKGIPSPDSSSDDQVEGSWSDSSSDKGRRDTYLDGQELKFRG
ncbi:hypothetical protein AURDEDRAFT_150817 [Auricularia subglabra TFB-10046 SS5]|nr:hypothetical protein AURDEDRAFT_150817 [Auricularia subglabra TFB-10046 SS5]